MAAVPLAAPARPSAWAEHRKNLWFNICFWVAGVLPASYNAILAFINARGVPTPRGAAVLMETSILATCLIACVLAGSRKLDIPVILFGAFAFVDALLISIGNDTIYVDFFRNMAIISAFTAVGLRCPAEKLHPLFRIMSALVLIFLLIEIFYLPLYVSIFQPAKYLEASRGIEQFSLNDTGLFANALGFQDRFSFGVFSGPRTSSIFLEQVSLPGFASVLLIFLLGHWKSLLTRDRILHTGLIVLIILSNNSRTSSALLLINAVGYFIYPYISGRLTVLLMPALLALAFILTGMSPDASQGDDLIGRLYVTVSHLQELSVKDFLFGSLAIVPHAFDSGYVYLIVSSSIFGLLAFWVYVTFLPACTTASQRRVHWGLAIYVYLWLLIGGTAIFTMKTAALLWLVVGNMAAHGISSARLSARPASEESQG